jgi:energy-coupling factor transporter ATP-binding protein EcfA2
MSLKIITADERAAETSGVKALIVGPHGVGKTTLIRTLDASGVLFMDIEAGDLAVRDVPVRGTVRPETWPEMRDVACWLGGPKRQFTDVQSYSQAHYDHVCAQLGDPADALGFDTLFVDSISVASRTCLAWGQTQPEAYSEKTGKPDLRGAYGLLGREFVGWVTQLQHIRGKNVILLAGLDQHKDDFGRLTWEIQVAGQAISRQLPGIFDQVVTMAPIVFGEGEAPVRAFVTQFGNPYGFPAKDRSGRLEPIEEPHLGKLIAKAGDQQRQRSTFSTTIEPTADVSQAA